MAGPTDSSARRQNGVNNFSCQNKIVGQSIGRLKEQAVFAALQQSRR